MTEKPKTYRAIVIDPHARTVEAVEWDGSPEQTKQFVQAEVDGGNFGRGLAYFCDEWGRVKPNQSWFELPDIYHSAIAGRTLIYSYGIGGETVDCPYHIIEIKMLVVWLDEPPEDTRATPTVTRFESLDDMIKAMFKEEL